MVSFLGAGGLSLVAAAAAEAFCLAFFLAASESGFFLFMKLEASDSLIGVTTGSQHKLDLLNIGWDESSGQIPLQTLLLLLDKLKQALRLYVECLRTFL